VAVTKLKAEGKVTPAEEVGLADFMAALENGTAEFSFTAAGTSTPTKKTPAQWFADFMAARAPVVKLGADARLAGDQAAADVNLQDGVALGNAAREFMAAEERAGRMVTVEAAVAHVTARQTAR
jgi:hypothetical protein